MAPARRRHWWASVVGAAVVLILGVTGSLVIPYLFRTHPGPLPLGSALRTFQGKQSNGTGTPRSKVPAQGVYPLGGQGTESISFPPNSQHDGTVIPASLTYLADDCWRWHVDYNVAHWEEYDYCPRGTQLHLAAFRNSQSWDFGALTIKNLARFTCPSATPVLPGDPKPGWTLTWSCTGTNTAVSGRTTAVITVRIVGFATVRIGRAVVLTTRELQQMKLTGAQTGTSRTSWWFLAGTGVPVQMERHITISSNSPIGTVTYNEAGSWYMTSLHPRT